MPSFIQGRVSARCGQDGRRADAAFGKTLLDHSPRLSWAQWPRSGLPGHLLHSIIRLFPQTWLSTPKAKPKCHHFCFPVPTPVPGTRHR